jgi:hypothetical protein
MQYARSPVSHSHQFLQPTLWHETLGLLVAREVVGDTSPPRWDA